MFVKKKINKKYQVNGFYCVGVRKSNNGAIVHMYVQNKMLLI